MPDGAHGRGVPGGQPGGGTGQCAARGEHRGGVRRGNGQRGNGAGHRARARRGRPVSRAAGALLVVGDVVTDVVARHRTPLAPATDTAAEIRTLPGGAGANAACWAARSGCADVRVLGRVGTDAADWHERALRRAGVRPLLVRDAEAATASVIALVDASAERTFLTDSGAALRLSPGDWSAGLLDGVARLHLSGYLFFAAPSRG
ncbi:PfkB family carbohydrate kinase, partial [Streptomyces sp. NPDC059556]|uniref:PfkB family carbohydrate kinase n=1 Tax=Streptomyces sp. NPDC059556 TaxID=3346863 RepID=UPI0036CB9EF1